MIVAMDSVVFGALRWVLTKIEIQLCGSANQEQTNAAGAVRVFGPRKGLASPPGDCFQS